jgi:hypothetical protein
LKGSTVRKSVVVLVALLAFAAFVIWSQSQRLQDLRAEVRDANDNAKTWEEKAGSWQESSQKNGRVLRKLRRHVEESVGSLDAPHFSIWNSCGGTLGCPIGPGSYYAGGVPDTFTFYPHFRSTVPVKVMIMTLDDFVCFRTGCGYHYHYWGPSKVLGSSIDDPENPYDNPFTLDAAVWHLSEGCADYVVVYTAQQSGRLYPNESVTYNPAQQKTGVCR